jgi:hypothetical protein
VHESDPFDFDRMAPGQSRLLKIWVVDLGSCGLGCVTVRGGVDLIRAVQNGSNGPELSLPLRGHVFAKEPLGF